jgi:ribosome maturation factor RimP
MGFSGGSTPGPPLLFLEAPANPLVDRPMRTLNPLEEKLLALIEPAAGDLGYRIVRIRMSGLRRKTVQIMGERIADGGMGIEDCERLSRAIAPVLDAHDPIKDQYSLEVSSPGIDRPLVRLEDFNRFLGHEVKLETVAMVEGRRRFRGVIEAVEGDGVILDGPDLRAVLAFSNIREARLVLTDALIAEDLKRARDEEAKDVKTLQPLSVPEDLGEPATAALAARAATRKPNPAKKPQSKRKDP